MTVPSKLRVLSFFIIINSIGCFLGAYFYFAYYPNELITPLGALFLVTSSFSQMTLLCLALGLLALPALLIKQQKIRWGIIAFIATISIVLLIVDIKVFEQYKFHLNYVVIRLVFSDNIVSFEKMMWAIAIFAFLLIFLTEFSLLLLLEKIEKKLSSKIQYLFYLTFFICLLATHTIHIWAAANSYRPVTMVKKYLPLFYPATSNRLMERYGWINQDQVNERDQLFLKEVSDLKYPLSPLQTRDVENKLNIVIIVIDSWRGDTFNAKITPHIWQYSQKGITFNQHISTGNATRTGIFGLFYGIPGTYWHSFLSNQRAPVLFERLSSLDYQTGIFAAAKLNNPEFDRTVFSSIHPLRAESKGNTPSELDADLLKDWQIWWENLYLNPENTAQQPSFSFLFFDAPHGYDFPPDYPPQFQPMSDGINYLALSNDYDPLPLFNRYKTSVHYVDSLVGDVLNTLEKTNQLDNTLVIITGDHGQELNDNRLNYWGHNSNYTSAQTWVPLIITDPRNQPNSPWAASQQMTSHADIVPTLMRAYLGVESPEYEYSTGINLYGDLIDRDWILSSSYSGYGVIGSDYILEVNGVGVYAIYDKKNQYHRDQKINSSHLKQALEQMNRFSK